MTRFYPNVVFLSLVCVTLLLLFYTFSGHGGSLRQQFHHHLYRISSSSYDGIKTVLASSLPSQSGDSNSSTNSSPSASPSRYPLIAATVASTVPVAATINPSRMLTLFRLQAAQRKSMFNAALAKSKPSVIDVLLPIVPEARCPLLVRIGSVGDGGKWVCNPWAMPRGGAVFSLGSRNDISFEQEFQRETSNAAEIVTVDMNAASQYALDGLAAINAKFVHAKIADKTDLTANPPIYTVIDLMTMTGHNKIELLKMDIEWAEEAVLPQFLKSDIVCQIMVEIHSITALPKLLRAVADAGFYLQKFELNPYGAATAISEYSFIHESCLDKYGATLLASYLKQ